MKQEEKVLIGIVAIAGIALLIKKGISDRPYPAANIIDAHPRGPSRSRREEGIYDRPLPGAGLLDANYPTFTGGTIIHPEYLPPVGIYKLQ